MREQLHENLMGFNELAKGFDGETELNDRQLEALQAMLDFRTAQAARQRGSDQEAQLRIFDIQQEKEVVMKQLHADLAGLDDPEHKFEQPEGALKAVWRDGQLVVRSQGGQEQTISLGEAITDFDWDKKYFLDPETVPRNIRKKYSIEAAKRQLGGLVNEQIVIDETSSGFTDWKKKDTYHRIAEDRERGILWKGEIAEKMVRNFLEKLSFDYPELDFTLMHADIFEDVAHKIDFIIHIKRHYRGVNIETKEQVGDKGVQFTINPSEPILGKKREQLQHVSKDELKREHIDDIVLVQLSGASFMSAYDQWQTSRAPGGPDKLWDSRTKEEIFRGVMNGLMSREEIDKQWSIAAGRANTRAAA